MRGWTTVAALITTFSISAAAVAQPAPSTQGIGPSHGWSAQTGYEVFSLRDISRSGTPPDASPIAWRGTGPVVTGRYEFTRPRSAHLADVSVSRSGDFAYAAPTRSTAANDNDFAYRMEGRYEYRRYLWRDLGIDGFDIGVGAQGAGARVGFDRHIASALQSKTRITGGGLAGVVSMRLRHWRRLAFDASWGNGAIISSRRTDHSASPDAAESVSGGSWLSDLAVRGDFALTPAASLSVSWRSAFELYQSNHFSFADDRHSFNVGIRYAY